VTLRETVFVEEDSVIADALDRKEIQSDDMYSIVPKLKCLAPGTVIPKPEAKDDFTLKGWGKRNGESALIYLIPNHSDPQRPIKRASLRVNGNKRISGCSLPASSPENGSTPRCPVVPERAHATLPLSAGFSRSLVWRRMTAEASTARFR
jgi:hypothetical protein